MPSLSNCDTPAFVPVALKTPPEGFPQSSCTKGSCLPQLSQDLSMHLLDPVLATFSAHSNWKPCCAEVMAGGDREWTAELGMGVADPNAQRDADSMVLSSTWLLSFKTWVYHLKRHSIHQGNKLTMGGMQVELSQAIWLLSIKRIHIQVNHCV